MWLALLTVTVLGVQAASATSPTRVPMSFAFFYTTAGALGGHATAATNVWRGRYNVLRGRLELQSPVAVAHVTRADGVIRLPSGTLLVRSSGDRLVMVNPRTGRITHTWDVARARNVVLDPSGRLAWILGRPGSLVAVHLAGSDEMRRYTLHGADRDLTDLAFDSAGQAFYLARGGDFGTLDTRRLMTNRIFASLPEAKDMLFDPFSGDLVLVGRGQIAQIDPRTLTIVADVDLNSLMARATAHRVVQHRTCDRASSDGRGRLLVACGRALAFVQLARGQASGISSVAVARLSSPASGLAPAVTAKPDLGPYVKKHCRPHHCFTPIPVFTG
jgi:hypothetical protein